MNEKEKERRGKEGGSLGTHQWLQDMNENIEERINLQKAVFEIEDANLFNRYELKQLEEFLSTGGLPAQCSGCRCAESAVRTGKGGHAFACTTRRTLEHPCMRAAPCHRRAHALAHT